MAGDFLSLPNKLSSEVFTMKKKKRQKAKVAPNGQKQEQQNKTGAKAVPAAAAGQVKLPPDVTEAPQDQEHLHLALIKHSPPLMDVYLKVSDDKGEFLGDVKLEKRVQEFVEQYEKADPAKIKDLDKVLTQAGSLYDEYTLNLARFTGISEGVMTKYSIRAGRLQTIEKKLVKQAGKKWIQHFIETHGHRHLRSAQHYMSVAAVPNVIRYSTFGIAKLVEMVRAVKALKIEGDDPVGSFLAGHKIDYDPEKLRDTNSVDQVKVEVDLAIARMKIAKLEKKEKIDLGLNDILLKKIIGLGKKIDQGFIRDLVVIKKTGGKINDHLERVYIDGGSESEIVKATRRVVSFPKLVIAFGNLVNQLKGNDELVGQIKPEIVRTLERHLVDLKALVRE
jgi:hypothetical protein